MLHTDSPVVAHMDIDMPQPWFSLGIATFCLLSSSSIQALDAPLGGWRDSRMQVELEQYHRAYPVTPVDRGAQKGRTLIEGVIPNYRPQAHPHVLVVNGTAMPLYTDEQGRFARPYAFGAGSNSIEIRSPEGKSLQRVQFYEANAGITAAKLRAILTWDDPTAEVDLHVITPNGEHAYFAQPQLPSGGGLDVDSVDGAGPEIFSTSAPLAGNYLFFINYWGSFDSQGYNFDEQKRRSAVVTCTLTLIQSENTPDEQRESYIIPLRKIGDLTLGRSIRLL
jgi:uncharacterized protein YfaP (DUF2135 family)